MQSSSVIAPYAGNSIPYFIANTAVIDQPKAGFCLSMFIQRNLLPKNMCFMLRCIHPSGGNVFAELAT